MTLLEQVFAHPVITAFLLLVGGAAGGNVVTSILEPFAPCRRGDCPRCNGTGAEPRVRKEAQP